MNAYERYRGALLGLAAGDALGTTLEFKPPGSFEPLTDMVGGGPFNLDPGQWTDDTSMALCLAQSLIECEGFDARDQIERYVAWYRQGYLSSTGTCFDIGNTVLSALTMFEETGDPFSGPTDEYSAGNGSIMRLAPVPLYFADTPELAMDKSAESSRTTHGVRAAVDACRYFGGLLVGAVEGVSKQELLSPRYSPAPEYFDSHPLVEKIDTVAAGSFKEHDPPRIRGSGYVVESLEAALWAFHRTDTFEEGALAAVNLGNDADTTGAVYGQLAGAFYGADSIPDGWLEKLTMRDEIERLSQNLLDARATDVP